MALSAALAVPSGPVRAGTSVRVADGDRPAFRREVIGVNHLAYGRDGLGYGMILPGSHCLDPQLVAWQREIGFGSLRYPGGCGGTHRFEWKRNAGLDGDYSVLGVMEFLGMCESCGATPVLGLSAHRGTPQEAAEFVEFLNAPEDAARPWAQRRAQRGHPAPYNAVWFEYGNEPYHGMTCSTYRTGKYPVREITAEGYCDAYLAFRDAMRAVDPRVKLGASLCGGNSLWDRTVLARLGDVADFFVVHSYANVPERADGDAFRALFDDRSEYLRRRFDEIGTSVGARARIAVTEFGARQTQHTTLAAALVNLSTLMDFAADSRIVHADYWQFVNEGFGMVRGERGAFVKRPTAWAFQLFSSHTLDWIVESAVAGSSGGAASGCPAVPDGWTGRNAMDGVAFRYSEDGTPDGTGTRYTLLPDGTHRLEFLDDRYANFYQLSALLKGLPVSSPCRWRVSCEMWTESFDPARPVEAHLELVDGRGWGATKSAASGDDVSGIDPIRVSFDYAPLDDNPGSLLLRFRRTGAGAGSVFVRDLRVEAVPKTASAGPAVRAQLSVSDDGSYGAGVFLNRSFEPQDVRFDAAALLPDGAVTRSASGEVLCGPHAYATNEEDPRTVELRPLAISVEGGIVSFTLPPHSAAGIRVSRFAGMAETRVVAREPGRYESWPFVETLGSRIVVAYSDGERHNAGERGRGVLAKVSDDGGGTWSEPVAVVRSPDLGASAVGKGRDNEGRMLLWTRVYGGEKPGFTLFRTADGRAFERVSHLPFFGRGPQIMDVVNVDGRLVSLFFTGDYKTPETFSWGVLSSDDDGATWTHRTVESGMPLAEWPTEPSAVHLGNGRILAIGRTEVDGGRLFSLVSEDGGETWTKSRTNIGDVMRSTPTLLFDPETGLVTLYYYERGRRLLKRRMASAEYVFADPDAWPEPEIVAIGDESRATDAGNPNAAVLGRRHLVVWYSGPKRPDATVYVTTLDP